MTSRMPLSCGTPNRLIVVPASKIVRIVTNKFDGRSVAKLNPQVVTCEPLVSLLINPNSPESAFYSFDIGIIKGTAI